MILVFNNEGVLPPGDYPMTFSQIRKSLLVKEPKNYDGLWDMPWRLKLVNNLEILIKHLWTVKITEIFINGSFVEDKGHPNDIDGYFECDIKSFHSTHSKLLKLDDCWTWDPNLRKSYSGHPKKQLPMWHKYRIELYPQFDQLSGITDEFGKDQLFPAAFRKTRGTPPRQKGIIKIKKEEGE